MKRKIVSLDQKTTDEWRELGFFYEFDEKFNANQWRFYGSKRGLQNFVVLLEEYTKKTENDAVSQHEHFGPYDYLKIMTWDRAIITSDYIAGTIQDLKRFQWLISTKLEDSMPGQTFSIKQEYGQDNQVAAKFFVMADDFDPASMDEFPFAQ